MTTAVQHLDLLDIEPRVCRTVERQLGLGKGEVRLDHRVLADLHLDSLDAIELIMGLEDEFGVALPDDPSTPVYKVVFTRRDFRVSDLAELVYLQQGLQPVLRRTGWRRKPPAMPIEPARSTTAFTQLGGVWRRDGGPLMERLPNDPAGRAMYRRRSDGMVCIQMPAATVSIGSNEGEPDEGPAHLVDLSAFLIDSEPVSTTAYARFLNSIGPVHEPTLAEWFALPADDHRRPFEPLRWDGERWVVVPGAERLPMVLVSWYGANAYSRWANGRDWRYYRTSVGSGLPTEAQWEYAARGPTPRRWPWGDHEPTDTWARFGRHARGQTYTGGAAGLPMAAVNEDLGLSPMGPRHMAGNVWQWCRDGYAPDFYATSDAREVDPLRPHGEVRSERGGSWIATAALCRSSYRRGRSAAAKGRCLGFRCVSSLGV